MGEENYPVGFIIGLETTDNGNQVADLIHKMNTAPHPTVINMDGGAAVYALFHYMYHFITHFILILIPHNLRY
jgi:hypothetical protein